MTTLCLDPNLRDVDGLYQSLIALHAGRSEAESLLINAKLILLLFNHVGDEEVLRDAMRLAGERE